MSNICGLYLYLVEPNTRLGMLQKTSPLGPTTTSWTLKLDKVEICLIINHTPSFIFLAFHTSITSYINSVADSNDTGVGLCGLLLTGLSWGIVLATLPFSLVVCFKV